MQEVVSVLLAPCLNKIESSHEHMLLMFDGLSHTLCSDAVQELIQSSSRILSSVFHDSGEASIYRMQCSKHVSSGPP